MYKITIIVLAFLFLCLFLAPQTFGVIGAQECDDNSPNGKPVLISAIPGEKSVTLTWTKATDPVTHYLVAYGKSATNMEYGNQNIGGKDATTYTVGELAKGVKYYFKVRPVNGCRPGDYSNKLSAIPGQPLQKNATKSPNLSIYKPAPTKALTESATPETNATDTPVVVALASGNMPKCTACNGWQFLIVEAVFLIAYFYFAKKNKLLKQIYSILIPVGIYLLYWNVNQGCSLRSFTCKYFAPLEVIIFIVVLIAYKTKHMNIKNKII